MTTQPWQMHAQCDTPECLGALSTVVEIEDRIADDGDAANADARNAIFNGIAEEHGWAVDRSTGTTYCPECIEEGRP
jgi:hypothetical protein